MSDPSAEAQSYEPCEGCGGLLDASSFSPFDIVVCPLCTGESTVKRVFGSYRLEQRYAIGGMSVIYVGWDATLNRKVAIKILNEEYCNDEIRIQAFENEARLTAQVSHPNVVKVFAVGRAYGRFYLVMELLEGRSFERIMSKKGALPEDEVLDIASQVAAGLQAAKRSGMIHRDVKPGNILIDQDGRARLLDFGLALITQDGRAQAAEVWATPYYVPPEALERGIEDFRSDIYAFGATLYHALAGRPPFESTSTSNSILRRAKQTIPRLCKVAPWISPNTGEAIDRMMAFQPEHRWASYGQVMQALERAKLTIGQATPTPIHSQTRLKRRQKRNSFGLVFATLLVLVCGGLAMWQPWTKDSPRPLPPPEVLTNQDEEEIDFNPSGGDRKSMQKRWQDARKLAGSGDYDNASGVLLAISEDPTVEGMEKVWSSFEASVVNALAGRPGAARNLVAQSLSDLDELPSQKNLVRRFRKLAEVLERIPPPEANDFPKKPKGIVAWMSTFALALKQWEQGQWEAALPSFASVRSASMPDELAWFRNYQNIADVYLADAQILSRLKSYPEPTNADEASRAIRELADATKTLRTKGRALYNLRARQAHLARLRKGFQKGPVVREARGWHKITPLLSQHARACRFDEIAALLEDTPKGTPAEALWAWKYLQRNGSAFINDLATQKNWNAENKDGNKMSPISGNSAGIELAGGTVVPWSDLKPESLIKEHARDEKHAIAFAWLVGLTNEAEDLAEDLASRDEDFRRDWRRVIVGTSQ